MHAITSIGANAADVKTKPGDTIYDSCSAVKQLFFLSRLCFRNIFKIVYGCVFHDLSVSGGSETAGSFFLTLKATNKSKYWFRESRAKSMQLHLHHRFRSGFIQIYIHTMRVLNSKQTKNYDTTS